jgi:hypothetical protein
MDNMEKLTHPVELCGEELDLVAAGWSNQSCGCEREGGSLISVGNVNVANNNNIASGNVVGVGILGVGNFLA